MSFETMGQPETKRGFFKTLLDTACQGIGEHLPDPDGVEKVASALENPHRIDRRKAFAVATVGSSLAFAACGRKKEKQEKFDIDQLISDLRSPDQSVRLSAAQKLAYAGEFGTHNITPATYALANTLENITESEEIRTQCAFALTFVTKNSQPGVLNHAVMALNSVDFFTDKSWKMKHYALIALANLVGSVGIGLQSKVMYSMLVILEYAKDTIVLHSGAAEVIQQLSLGSLILSQQQHKTIEKILNADEVSSDIRNVLFQAADIRRVSK